MEAYILHHSPDNADATCFRRKGINLIGSLADVTEKALNRVGGLDMPMHRCWKSIKGEKMLLVFDQTADRFWIPLLIFGFESGQLSQRVFLLFGFPNANQLGLDRLALPARDRIEHIALLMNQTALTRSRCK